MILVDNRLQVVDTNERYWRPDVQCQVFDAWTEYWFDFIDVSIIANTYIFRLTNDSRLETLDLKEIPVRLKDANTQSSS